MGKQCFIARHDLSSRYSPVTKLNNHQDVATVLEVYSASLQQFSSENIIDIVEESGHYFTVIERGSESTFDLFDFINKRYTGRETVNCINARLLFPIHLSRGLSNSSDILLNKESTDFGDDSPTGFMDENEVPELAGKVHGIFYRKLGISAEIPEFGLVIGRSAKKSDFLIRGNSDISRAHCRIYFSGGKLMVHDIDSLNGTFVNGTRVYSTRDITISPGDKLLLANEELEIH